jgi:hypothetical protein|tara:strand:- start:515 stop:883 length:369 start_codon:yes stop_codon:yes gene_type:complete
MNNNRRRNFRGRQQKNNFRRRSTSNHSNNGHFSNNTGNKNFNRNGSLSNPSSIEKVIFKYQQLAKDAQSSGDPVLIENYLQHAEHFSRKLAEINFKSKPAEDTSIKSDDASLNSDTLSEKKI